MPEKKYVLDVEIRQDTNPVPTNDPDISGVTVKHNSWQDVDLRRIESIRFHIADDHDAGLDVDIQHTHSTDTGYTETVTETTLSLASGDDNASYRFDGPVGKLRAVVQAGALAAAPAEGGMVIEAIGTG